MAVRSGDLTLRLICRIPPSSSVMYSAVSASLLTLFILFNSSFLRLYRKNSVNNNTFYRGIYNCQPIFPTEVIFFVFLGHTVGHTNSMIFLASNLLSIIP